jgi:chromosome segregation ATPase
MTESTTGGATGQATAPEATEKFKFDVAGYFEKFPATTKEFFEQIQEGFQKEVAEIKARTRNRIRDLEDRLTKAGSRIEMMEKFQGEQRAEVDRLVEENKRLQGDQKGALEIESLRQQVNSLKLELSRRRDAEKTLVVRDQTIDQLKANNRELKRRLEQAKQHDVQAVVEELRSENRSLKKAQAELSEALSKCQTDAAGDYLRLTKQISDLEKENRDLAQTVQQLQPKPAPELPPTPPS